MSDEMTVGPWISRLRLRVDGGDLHVKRGGKRATVPLRSVRSVVLQSSGPGAHEMVLHGEGGPLTTVSLSNTTEADRGAVCEWVRGKVREHG